MPEYLPLPPPEPLGPKPKLELSPEHDEIRLKVLEHFSNKEYVFPGVSEPDKATLTDLEKLWLTNDCFLRYLRASKWQLEAAIRRIEETLKWRREYGIYDRVTAEHVEPEGVTGKEVLFGFDTQNRPGFLMIPSRQNTQESPRQLEYVAWMMERAIDLMGPGVESMAIMINFADRGKNPSISTARGFLHILQNHYPERLGQAVVINIPFLIHAFFKVILPFVDPVTREKIKMNPNVVEDGLFTKENLMTEWWGGTREFEYKHEEYWPALVKLCDQRREEQLARWKDLGGIVGLDEWDIRGGPSGDESLPKEPTVKLVTSAITEEVQT